MKKEDKLKFKKLFGIDAESLGKNFIVSPFLNPKIFKEELEKPEFFSGLIFKGLRGIYKKKRISFINTGMGHTFVNDCIAAQEAEKIESVVFLGAVGAIDNLSFADCVVIEEAYFDNAYYEQFGISKMEHPQDGPFKPEISLFNLANSLAKKQKIDLKKSRIMSLNSLWEQDEKMILGLKKKNIQAVELEAALFYGAARNKKIPAVALCFVSDLLLSRPFWSDTSFMEQAQIKQSIAQLRKLALEISISG